MTGAIDANLHALVDQAIGMHAVADSGFIEEIHRNLFNDAGAHAPEHVFRCLPFKDDIGDAAAVQELPKQQSRRTRTNNNYLRPHESPVQDFCETCCSTEANVPAKYRTRRFRKTRSYFRHLCASRYLRNVCTKARTAAARWCLC
jgi:hypothetical protein